MNDILVSVYVSPKADIFDVTKLIYRDYHVKPQERGINPRPFGLGLIPSNHVIIYLLLLYGNIDFYLGFFSSVSLHFHRLYHFSSLGF